MSSGEERDEDAPAPHTDRNPGTLPTEPLAVKSGARRASSDAPGSSDTLLSAPTPATRDDFAQEERISAAETRLDDLERRIETLERERKHPKQPTAERNWWLWLVFLAALALAWQIVARFR